MILATYNEDGSVNAMNAAWGGICDYDKLCVSLGEHKTTENIRRTGAFTVAFADKEHVIPCDYLGVVSGNDEPDKFTKAGFTARKSEFVNAPVINELPVCLECEFYKVLEGGIYIGKIVNTSAEENILGEDEKPDPAKFTPIVFEPAHNTYIALGETVGKAFSDGLALR